MRRAGAVVALALALGGCLPSGRDFVRPTPMTFRLGESSLADVTRMYGEPADQRAWARSDRLLVEPPAPVPTPFGSASVGGSMRELHYQYAWRLGESATGGVLPTRTMRLWFWNDKLVGYRAVSSFKADVTGFDEAKVAALTAWKSLRSDVTDLLGPPSGLAGYPMARLPDQQILIYQAFEFDTSRSETRAKVLYVLVNALGVVEDTRFDSSAEPIPPAPATGGGGVTPIFIPQPKSRSR